MTGKLHVQAQHLLGAYVLPEELGPSDPVSE